MSTYTVMKDFPSRNGARQYRAGQVVQFGDNTRTKALVEMGYLEEMALPELDLPRQIHAAVWNLNGVKNVQVFKYGKHDGEFLLKVTRSDDD